jgi:hypothetical protein
MIVVRPLAIGLGVDLDDTVQKVDEPIDRHFIGGVDLPLDAAIECEARVGDFDDELGLRRRGMPCQELLDVTADDDRVRLRLAPLQRERVLNPERPAGSIASSRSRSRAKQTQWGPRLP